MQNNFHTWLPDKKPKKTTIHLDPVDFFSEAMLRSPLIKNKEDRKQFMDWAVLFKDRVEKTMLPNGECRYVYFTYSSIIFDGVDAITCIEGDGTIVLSKGELSLSDSGPDDIYPMEMWTRVAKANPYEMLDIIVDQYNNVDNRYMCKIHGEIRYKRHNGPWTSK